MIRTGCEQSGDSNWRCIEGFVVVVAAGFDYVVVDAVAAELEAESWVACCDGEMTMRLVDLAYVTLGSSGSFGCCMGLKSGSLSMCSCSLSLCRLVGSMSIGRRSRLLWGMA